MRPCASNTDAPEARPRPHIRNICESHLPHVGFVKFAGPFAGVGVFHVLAPRREYLIQIGGSVHSSVPFRTQFNISSEPAPAIPDWHPVPSVPFATSTPGGSSIHPVGCKQQGY